MSQFERTFGQTPSVLMRQQFPSKISSPLANAFSCVTAKFFIVVDKDDLITVTVGEARRAISVSALLNRPRMPFSLGLANVMLTNNLMMNVI